MSESKKLTPHVILEINLKNLRFNYSRIKKRVSKKTIVAATVKADGYGMGSHEVVKSLIKEKCNIFFVATLDEAISLRKKFKQIQIQVLNGFHNERVKDYDKYNIIPIINSLQQLRAIEDYSKKIKKINISIHFDTGISRLGLDKHETEYLLKKKESLIKHSNLKMIMSHLACGDRPKHKKNKAQLKLFRKICTHFPGVTKSLSNSAGVLLGRNYDFDLVRPGISLYGGHCQENQNSSLYKNVISLKSKIIQKRIIFKDDTVGYGGTFKAKNKMLIGTIPIGYADGFFRSFSNKGSFYLLGKKVPIIGRISMDLTTIDLTSLRNRNLNKNVFVEVISNKNNINYLSKIISTIPYEILTSLGKRYQRRYIA
tara:strand:- start:1971 stop:3080 length:1110 start_codon:yes stop_codon:yes gene_type:complete